MKALIFDTETTGLPAKSSDLKLQPKIIELAAIGLDLDTGEEFGRFDSLFNPEQRLDPIITKITGLKDEDLRDAPLFGEKAPAFLSLVQKADAIVAHNLSFDHSLVTFEFMRLGMEERWFSAIPKGRICTVEQTIFLKRHRLRLSDLHEFLFGEPFAGAHRAMVDVEALVRCCIELRKRGIL